MFSVQSVSYNPLVTTFQLSSAASLNLGQSQNGVLGNGLSERMVVKALIHAFLMSFFTSFPHATLSKPLAAFKRTHQWFAIGHNEYHQSLQRTSERAQTTTSCSQVLNAGN